MDLVSLGIGIVLMWGYHDALKGLSIQAMVLSRLGNGTQVRVHFVALDFHSKNRSMFTLLPQLFLWFQNRCFDRHDQSLYGWDDFLEPSTDSWWGGGHHEPQQLRLVNITTTTWQLTLTVTMATETDRHHNNRLTITRANETDHHHNNWDWPSPQQLRLTITTGTQTDHHQGKWDWPSPQQLRLTITTETETDYHSWDGPSPQQLRLTITTSTEAEHHHSNGDWLSP